MLQSFAALVAVATLAPMPSTAPAVERRVAIRLVPPSAMLDTRIVVEVSGLTPRSTVGLRVTARDAEQRVWQTRVTARGDARGRLRRDGSALIPLLRPVANLAPSMRTLVLPATGLRIHVDLLLRDRMVAGADATRLVLDPAVSMQTLTLAKDGLVGRYRAVTGRGPAPAVLQLGGSEGGLRGDLSASLLASRGYPVLQLAYFGVEGLPQELKGIPLEYLEAGLRWLARQPGVDPQRLVVFGGSRGGELALLLGAQFPSLVDAVVAYVPSSVVNPGIPDCRSPAWTYRGEPVPHVDCEEFGTTKPKQAEAIIPVERVRGPLFLVGAVADGIWPSASFTLAIADRLKASGRSDFTALVYPRAGHGVGLRIPYLPLAGFDLASPVDDARARTDAWFKLLRFLDAVRLQATPARGRREDGRRRGHRWGARHGQQGQLRHPWPA